MGRMTRSGRGALALAAVVLAASGCASMDGMLGRRGGVGLPGARGDVLDGEVARVDLRREHLSVRGWDGRTRTVRVHRDTRVRYDRRTYPVSALERGDEVRVYVTVDRRGSAWADRVDVRRSVREHQRYGARVERLDGYLTGMSLRDGWMAVAPRRGGGEVIVHLPARLERRDARELERLRRGERVKLEVVPLGRGEAELVRFR